jgi:hypothetical protein
VFEIADAPFRFTAAIYTADSPKDGPVSDPDQLTYEVREEVRPSDLEKFMPRALSPWHPPG